MTDNRTIAIIAICSFISFAIGRITSRMERKRPTELTEHGSAPL